MTVYPASAKQINWIADLLRTRDWVNSGQAKYISRAATLNLMITWAMDPNATGEDGSPILLDSIRVVMSSDKVGERVNQGLAFILENNGTSDSYEYCYEPLTSNGASALIDWLKPMGLCTTEPACSPAGDPATDNVLASEEPESDELEDGMYRSNAGEYLKVYKTQKGHQVAKIARIEKSFDPECLSCSGDYDHEHACTCHFVVSFDYVGKRPLRDLRPSMKLTLAQAREFGMIYGTCVCCGRTLTDELSVYLGIGPVCGGRQFGSEGFKQVLKQAKSDIALKDQQMEEDTKLQNEIM